MANQRTRGETGRRTRWVWPAWWLLMTMLVTALVLWVVNGVARGVPGPVVEGVYLDGALDSAVMVVAVLAAGALTTVATIILARVPGNRIGRILWALSVWKVTTFFVTIVLYFLHSPTAAETAFANWLGSWTFVFFIPTAFVLMIFPTGMLPSPRWRALPWLAILGTLGWAATEAFADRLGLEGELANPFANPRLVEVGAMVSLLLLPALIGTVASLVLRYRHASTEVRAQIKWVGQSQVHSRSQSSS